MGGYWLLKNEEDDKYFIPIAAGLSFGTSLWVLPSTVGVEIAFLQKILPLLNVALFLGLGLYLLLKRKEKDIINSYKGVFIRSTIVLIIVSFFSYTPISAKPYRYLLMALNNGNKPLLANLKMFGYTEVYEKALENGDCEGAIENAKKANKAGLTWLGIPFNEDGINGFVKESTATPSKEDDLGDSYLGQNELWKISGTFTYLYEANKCKATEYFNNGAFEQALMYYSQANQALYACEQNLEYWQLEKATSLANLARCHKHLHNYQYADSLFIKAINKSQEINSTPDRKTAFIYRKFAESKAEQLQLENSNMLYKVGIAILKTDSLNEESKLDLEEAYFDLIQNYVRVDSFTQARFYINEALARVNKGSVNFCSINLLNGLNYYKLNQYKKAREVLSECLVCNKKYLAPTHQNIAETYLSLAQVKIALGEYRLAKYDLDKGIEITKSNFGENSVRHANYLKLYATLNKEVGNYRTSRQQFDQVHKIYLQELGEQNEKLPDLLIGLADLELILGNFEQAKAHSDRAISLVKKLLSLKHTSMAVLFNHAANVNYYLGKYERSDSLYRETIEIHKNSGISSSAQNAVALNGLGNVFAAKGDYRKADSLFARSLILHKEIFTDPHPSIATVYLNYAALRIQQNKLEQAKDMLSKSLAINKQFLAPKHDVFADVYVAFGDLAEKEGKTKEAQEYYQKALIIYLGKFSENHYRVKSTKRRIKIGRK